MSDQVFALKSQMIPLTVIELSSQDNQSFDQQLEAKVKTSPALFDRMPAILGLDEIEPIDESNIQKLLFTVRKYNIMPIALRGSDELKELAQKLDLAWIPPGRKKLQKQAQKAKEQIEASDIAAEQAKQNEQPEAAPEPNIETQPVIEKEPQQLELTEQPAQESANLSSEESTTAVAQVAPPATKIISTPVRSGQQIYAKDSDLIILSQVGQGAEVIADGNIHIYGTLRGRAIAGASGNKEARIFCQSLQAELISIAGIYQVSDDLPADRIGQSSQIELKENHLHIDTL